MSGILDSSAVPVPSITSADLADAISAQLATHASLKPDGSCCAHCAPLAKAIEDCDLLTDYLDVFIGQTSILIGLVPIKTALGLFATGLQLGVMARELARAREKDVEELERGFKL